MVVHYCRDMATHNGFSWSPSTTPAYFLALFLRRVIKFTQVGHTNFNVNSIGNLLIATGDTNPTGTASWSTPNRASILQNVLNVEVAIPIAVRTVSSADIDRVLVLKSDAYPKINSGLFRIIGVNTAQNRYIIDYRTFDTATAETSTLEWYLYENDYLGIAALSGNTPTLFPTNSTGNGSGLNFYNGYGPATATSRIILQSPHATAWQVRICYETGIDTSQFSGNNGGCPPYTVAPGYNGDSAGDFAVGGRHLHGQLHYNVCNSLWKGYALGGGGTHGFSTFNSHQMRVTMMGDESNIFLASRRINDTTTPRGGYLSFGLPENEPTPLPTDAADRLYVVGSSQGGNGENNDFYLQNGRADFGALAQGLAFSFGKTITCTNSLLAYTYGTAQYSGPHTVSTVADSPFTQDTELTPVELLAGVTTTWSISGSHLTKLSPRLMGNMRFVRCGRNNYGKFVLTTDSNKSWLSLGNGSFVPWGGPSLLP